MMENNAKALENTEMELKFPALFYMGLKELIHAKSNDLLELRRMELKFIKSKHDLAMKERTILLTTDFKELGLTNEKMRNSYVNEKLGDDKAKIDILKHEIVSKKDTIEIINDLIQLEMKGE